MSLACRNSCFWAANHLLPLRIKMKNILCILGILIFLTSCIAQPSSGIVPLASQPSEIKEPQLSEPYTELVSQEVRAFNCDGANPSLRVDRSLLQEQTTTLSVEVEAGGLIRGTPIPEVLQAEVEAKISGALASNLGSKYQQSISLDLITENGQALLHTIIWQETKVRGIVDIVYSNGTARINFQKVIGVELNGRQSQNLNCDGTSPDIETQSPLIATPTLIDATAISTTPPPAATELQPLRQHFEVKVGDGLFSTGTFSDGMAPYSEQWLWDNSHFKIQRIRQEEYPDGCDIARYDTDLVWIGGNPGMTIAINDETVGKYTIADNAHGYMFNWDIKTGDKVCAVNFKPSTGFHIILGPDIYYHYDSYCYRGSCQ